MEGRLIESKLHIAGVAGTPGQAAAITGVVPGVKYFRKFTKNGITRPAHVEFTAMRNITYYDANNQQVTKTDSLKLEAWNSPNDDGTGRGIADTLAKWGSVGKCISINAPLRIYKRKVYYTDGSIAKEPNGTDILVSAFSISISSMKNIDFFDDSDKTAAREVANHLAGMTTQSFFSRPPNWNTANHADSRAWTDLLKWRSAQKFEGGDYYGQAKVCLVAGAQPADGFGNVTTTTTAAATGGSVFKMLSPEQIAALSPAQIAAMVGAQVPATSVTQAAPAADTVGDEVPF